jgi:hypothetical protein
MKEFPHLMKWVERIAAISDNYMKQGADLMRIATCYPERLREAISILVNGEGSIMDFGHRSNLECRRDIHRVSGFHSLCQY